MRPTARPQSAIRYPLNHVLGTEAHVRVLRELMLSDIPIGASELARRASLQLSGVARVLTRLEDLGVIEAVGRGSRNRQYRRSPRFELNNLLVGLFSSERNRGDQILRALQQAVRSAGGIRAAWLQGPVAVGADAPEDTIVVGVLTDPDRVENVRLMVWQNLLGVQRAHALAVELRILTSPDLATLNQASLAELASAWPLSGPAPMDLLPGTSQTRHSGARLRQHGDLETRSLASARQIAELIKRDPSLVEDALRWIERQLRTAEGGELLELEEWQNILTTMSTSRLRRFLVQDDARARRLRQSSPFPPVLSAEARAAVRAGTARRR